jgi:hypothetical protein
MSICKDCICRKYCGDDDIRKCDRYFRDGGIKKEQTNEEWVKSLDTEGLVDYLYEVHKGGNSVERQRWIENHKERVKMQFRGWLKEIHK